MLNYLSSFKENPSQLTLPVQQYIVLLPHNYNLILPLNLFFVIMVFELFKTYLFNFLTRDQKLSVILFIRT